MRDPLCAPSGTFTVCKPSKVSKSTSVPSAAWATLIGMVQCSSSFCRSKTGCSVTCTTTYRSPGEPPCPPGCPSRSEEHTSELQSHLNLVCRLLLEKKKI